MQFKIFLIVSSTFFQLTLYNSSPTTRKEEEEVF